jgi:hypothetical protein
MMARLHHLELKIVKSAPTIRSLHRHTVDALGHHHHVIMAATHNGAAANVRAP